MGTEEHFVFHVASGSDAMDITSVREIINLGLILDRGFCRNGGGRMQIQHSHATQPLGG